MKTLLAVLVGIVIGFAIGRDPQITKWVGEQTAAVKKYIHEVTR